MNNHLDHLVVLAPTLEVGVDWCEQLLGLTPGPGGKHPLMGTHNRLLSLANTNYPSLYMEILAIDPDAEFNQVESRGRWFGLSNSALQKFLNNQGPQLFHAVVRVEDLSEKLLRAHSIGLDPGRILQAQRQTSKGILEWEILVRDDGQLLFNGCLPTLIKWGKEHPQSNMVDEGVYLKKIALSHPKPGELGQTFKRFDLSLPLSDGLAQWKIELMSPRGLVYLSSPDLSQFFTV